MRKIDNYLIQPIFFGFGFFTFILIYFKVVLKLNTERLIKSSIEIVKYSGIAYLSLWTFCLLTEENLTNRFIGKYWFSGWFLMFTFPSLSQLLWIKKIRNSNLLLYIISLVILCANIIFSGKIACFDGDCDMNSFLIGILKEIGIYILILLTVTYFMKNEK